MSSPPERPSLIQGLLRRRKRERVDVTNEANVQFDAALERLSTALVENQVVGLQLRRRQSSGGFKKIVPVLDAE
jgi:hypothetical protein